MTAIPTPSMSVKVATALDVISTLVAGQIGYAFSVPAYHPAILAYAVGVTYALFRWKDEITCYLLKTAAPLGNRNRYNYAQKAELFGMPKNHRFFVHYNKMMVQNLKFKAHMLKDVFRKNKAKENQKEVYLFLENRNFN